MTICMDVRRVGAEAKAGKMLLILNNVYNIRMAAKSFTP